MNACNEINIYHGTNDWKMNDIDSNVGWNEQNDRIKP